MADHGINPIGKWDVRQLASRVITEQDVDRFSQKINIEPPPPIGSHIDADGGVTDALEVAHADSPTRSPESRCLDTHRSA